jgi:hypothetical protein
MMTALDASCAPGGLRHDPQAHRRPAPCTTALLGCVRMIQLRACLDDYGLEGSRNQQETASTCELCEHLSSRPRVASSTIPGPQPSIITLPKVPHSTSCCAYVIEYVCVRKTMCKSGGRSAAHAGGDADGCGPLELPQTVRHVASAVTADAGGRPVVRVGWVVLGHAAVGSTRRAAARCVCVRWLLKYVGVPPRIVQYV